MIFLHRSCEPQVRCIHHGFMQDFLLGGGEIGYAKTAPLYAPPGNVLDFRSSEIDSDANCQCMTFKSQQLKDSLSPM